MVISNQSPLFSGSPYRFVAPFHRRVTPRYGVCLRPGDAKQHGIKAVGVLDEGSVANVHTSSVAKCRSCVERLLKDRDIWSGDIRGDFGDCDAVGRIVQWFDVVAN